MNYLIIIILSIIQGATEFLPISSSGHLVLFYRIFNIEDNTILLSVILHLATLCSVVVFYRKELWSLIKKPFSKPVLYLGISTILTLSIAILLMPSIENSFSGKNLPLCFIITAIILVIAENIDILLPKRKSMVFDNISKTKETKKPFCKHNPTFFHNLPNLKQAIGMGIVQGFATFPGISRSGSTIASGLILGAKKEGSANYSFLMSIPIILGSLILEVYKYIKSPVPLTFNILELSLGFVVAFIVGLLCIKLMLKFVSNQKLTIFSFYLLFLSLFLILNDKLLLWF